MSVLFYIVVVVVVVLVLFLMVLMHAGYFYDLRIRTSTPLSLSGRVAYRVYSGSYSNAGSAFKELAVLAPHLRTFGIYYDDPRRVPQPELRYVIGCYLPTENSSHQEGVLQGAGYKTWVFPKCSSAVMTEFPYRSMLSIIIAPSIVYPALKKYFQEFNFPHAGPVVELCEVDCLRYIAPLEHNQEFFVPEVSEIAESRKDQ